MNLARFIAKCDGPRQTCPRRHRPGFRHDRMPPRAVRFPPPRRLRFPKAASATSRAGTPQAWHAPPPSRHEPALQAASGKSTYRTSSSLGRILRLLVDHGLDRQTAPEVDGAWGSARLWVTSSIVASAYCVGMRSLCYEPLRTARPTVLKCTPKCSAICA